MNTTRVFVKTCLSCLLGIIKNNFMVLWEMSVKIVYTGAGLLLMRNEAYLVAGVADSTVHAPSAIIIFPVAQ